MPSEEPKRDCTCTCHKLKEEKKQEPKVTKTTKRSKKEKPVVHERMRIVPGGVVSFEDSI